MSFELLANFLLFCIGQSLVLIGVLAQKKFRKRHNRYLQIFLLFLIIYYLFAYSQFKGGILPEVLLTALSQPLELGVVILFFSYCNILLGIKRKVRWLRVTKRISFGLVFVWLLFSCIVFWRPAEQGVIGDLRLIGKSVQFLVRSWYVLLPLVLLFQFRKNRSWAKFLFGSIRHGEDWLRLTSMIVAVHGLFRVSVIVSTGSSLVSVLEWIDLAFYLIITYLLSFILISAPETLYPELKLERAKKGTDRKARFSPDEIHNFIQRMDALVINEKLFLDSEFSLGDLSDRMGLPVHHLSEIINQGHGLNFNDYINQFRVGEFKRLIQEPPFAKETLLAVAFEAGFNSKTTFNTAFKKFTGMTPSQFKRTVEE